jgi:hypothetical protein
MQPGWLPAEVAKPGHLWSRLGAARRGGACIRLAELASPPGAVVRFGAQAKPRSPARSDDLGVNGRRRGRQGSRRQSPPQGVGAAERISLRGGDAGRELRRRLRRPCGESDRRRRSEKGKLCRCRGPLARPPSREARSDLLGTKEDIVIQRGQGGAATGSGERGEIGGRAPGFAPDRRRITRDIRRAYLSVTSYHLLLPAGRRRE